MRPALLLLLSVLAGCPKRDLPQWKVSQMHRRASALAPCGSFHKGQRLGDGFQVRSIRNGYIFVRTREGNVLSIPCSE